MRNQRKVTILVVVLAFIFFAPSAFAGVPQLISFEGTLRDANGKTVADGSYDVTFAIYGSSSGGSALWTEAWSGNTSRVATTNGMFNVQLGTHNPIPQDFFSENSTTFLGIKVGLDAEMVPRQRISSVAYAFTAGSGCIPSGAIIMWSGSTIPPGWKLCDGTDETPDLTDRFIIGAGKNYAVKSSGGANSINISHTHSIASEAVTGTVGNHTHPVSIRTSEVIREGDYDKDVRDDNDKNAASNHHQHWVVGNTGAATASVSTNAHNHGGATGPGLTSNISIVPKYYALCFIMKK